MGLDVRVYHNLTQVDLSLDEDVEYDFRVFVIDDGWKHKVKNLEYGKYFNGEMAHRGVSYAYSSHNRFRESLIKLIDRPDLLDSDGKIKWAELPNDIPFIEFIDFADNEGCLDWEVSGIIYSDFMIYNDKAKETFDAYTYNKYEIWLETFEVATINKGVVVYS
jgi:hypothetical protein